MAERERREDIARDIEARRAEMAGTLEALQERVAPRRVADAAAAAAQREGAALSRMAMRRVRAQPVAAAMVVAGLAWLFLADAPPGRRPLPKPAPRRGDGRMHARGPVPRARPAPAAARRPR